jgi:hypothetical protein
MGVSPARDLLPVDNIGAGTVSLVSFDKRRELRRVEACTSRTT